MIEVLNHTFKSRRNSTESICTRCGIILWHCATREEVIDALKNVNKPYDLTRESCVGNVSEWDWKKLRKPIVVNTSNGENK